MSAPLIFLDVETTGLDPDDEVWEFAAIRREPDGSETTLHLFVEHDPNRAARLPERFLTDYHARWPGWHARTRRADAAVQIADFLGRRPGGERPHLIGAVVSFDAGHIERLLRAHITMTRPPWHHHVMCVETLAVGWLAARGTKVVLPWESDDLSRLCGVEPPGDDRHTAAGDADWAMRWFDALGVTA